MKKIFFLFLLLICSSAFADQPIHFIPQAVDSIGSMEVVEAMDCQLGADYSNKYGKICYSVLLKKITLSDHAGNKEVVDSIILFNLGNGLGDAINSLYQIAQAISGKPYVKANQKLTISTKEFKVNEAQTPVTFNGQKLLVRFAVLKVHFSGLYPSDPNYTPIDSDYTFGDLPNLSKVGLVFLSPGR